jgi:hypothetical protein
MSICFSGEEIGVHEMTISHKPSGEAGQNNYTTMLHWGDNLSVLLRKEHDITGKTLRLYAPAAPGMPFVLDLV